METSFSVYRLMICFVAMPVTRCSPSDEGSLEQPVVPTRCDHCSKMTSGFEEISGHMKQIFSKVSDCISVPRAPWLTKAAESSGTIVVSWTPGAGQVDKYVVSAQTESGNGITKTVDAPDENATLTENLVKGQTYTVSVKAISSGVTSAAGTTTSVTLVPAEPSLTTAEESSGTIVVSWTPGAGQVDQYVASAQPTNGTAVTKTVDAPAETATLSENLVQGQTYNVSVKAISNGVTSAAGTTTSVTLVPAEPSLTTAEESSGTIVVNWTPGAGQVDQYVVSAQPTNGTAVTKTVDAPAETATLSGYLAKGETYTVSVKAISNGVTSAAGTTKSLTMEKVGCPDNWVPYDGSCYYFQQYMVIIDHDSANIRCNRHLAGSALVAIETRGEYEFLRQHLRRIYSKIHNLTGNFWMTSGKLVSGAWKWASTGSAVDESTFTWGPRQPSGKHCLTMRPSSDFKMSTANCSPSRNQYICEI